MMENYLGPPLIGKLPSQTPPPKDVLTVFFLDSTGQPTFQISNWTTFNIERDFFVPADTFTLVLEDDRASTLTGQMFEGMAVRFEINNKNILVGYILSYHLTYTRSGGSRLEIRGQDLLGYMAKAVAYPNLGQSTTTVNTQVPSLLLGQAAVQTNFHFTPQTTIQTALTTIFNAFRAETQLPQAISVEVEDGPYLTFATGFATGLKSRGKTGRGLVKSMQNSLDRLTTPGKGESYLAYAIRLCKHIGCDIKMAPDRYVGTDVVFVSPPTYDRMGAGSPYNLVHYAQGVPTSATYGYTSDLPLTNNILEGSIKISFEDQPSAIILEMATAGNNAFYSGAFKCVVVNELTGYYRSISEGGIPIEIENSEGNGNTLKDFEDLRVFNVGQAIKQLTNGQLGTGYRVLNPNTDLFFSLPFVATQMQTEVSMPRYYVDMNAHTKDELSFGTAKAMAEAQDKYMVLNYKVDGFTQNGVVWYPNQLCYVKDEVFSYPYQIDGVFWIKKVNFTRTRDGGSHTFLELTLPYTHQFDITTPFPTILKPETP